MDEKIEISVAKLQVQVQRFEEDMSEMKGDVKAIRATLDETKGSWKMLLMVGGFAAAIGGLITKAMSVWTIR